MRSYHQRPRRGPEQHHQSRGLSLGGLVPHGLLSEEEIFDELMGAAQEGNHPAGRAASTISSGLRAGMEQPRELPDLEESSTDWDFSEDLLRIIKKSDKIGRAHV